MHNTADFLQGTRIAEVIQVATLISSPRTKRLTDFLYKYSIISTDLRASQESWVIVSTIEISFSFYDEWTGTCDVRVIMRTDSEPLFLLHFSNYICFLKRWYGIFQDLR